MSGHIISMNGWDTAFAISYADVNSEIARRKSSPEGYEQTVADSSGTYSSKGQFGDWQLDPERGAGGEVHMLLPVKKMTLTMADEGEDPLSKSFENMTAKIEVELQYIHEKIGEDCEPTDRALKPHEVVGKVSFPDVPILWRAVAEVCLKDWLDAHLGTFDHVFAVVDLQEQAGEGKLSWLKPDGMPDYAVLADGSPDTSIFAVLSMTGGRPRPKGNVISPFALDGGGNSALLIAPDIFMKNMLFPGVPLLFKDATPQDFDFENDGRRITNKTRLKLQSLKMTDGSLRHPILEPGRFSLELQGDRLRIEFTDNYWEESPGITIHLEYVSYGTLRLDPDSRHLDINEAVHSYNTYVAETEAVHWIKIISSIALAVGGAVLGGVIGKAVGSALELGESAAVAGVEATIDEAGQAIQVTIDVTETLSTLGPDEITNLLELEAAYASGEVTAALEGIDIAAEMGGFFLRNWPKMVGAMIGAGLGEAIALIPDYIEIGGQDLGPGHGALDQFAEDAIAPVAWPGSSGYKLVDARLQDVLVLDGHYMWEGDQT